MSDVLLAAVKLAQLDMLSHAVAAPAAGLQKARNNLNDAVCDLVGVDPLRRSKFGHVDYSINKWLESQS